MSKRFSRTLTLVSIGGRKSTVTVGFGPIRVGSDGTHWVRVRIVGLWEAPWSLDLAGGDGVSAVEHALNAVARKLESTEEFKAGRLYWLHPDFGHGFNARLRRLRVSPEKKTGRRKAARPMKRGD